MALFFLNCIHMLNYHINGNFIKYINNGIIWHTGTEKSLYDCMTSLDVINSFKK